MAIELARKELLPRPWGVTDLRPWYTSGSGGEPIGELRFERPGHPAADPALLLKLLFTSQPLSIQVHPNDIDARAMGEANGKAEAWYVVSAECDAKIALGLKERRTLEQLRQAAEDSSLAELVKWQPVSADNVFSVPAGTIHALGAGLVIAEIQQRSDTTFRLYDHGRSRELHIDKGVAVADLGPAASQAPRTRLTAARSLLVTCPQFVFERIELPADTTWCLDAERETWLLILSGSAMAGLLEVSRGDAVFAQADRINIRAGEFGVIGLVAYTGALVVLNLLKQYQPLAGVDGIGADGPELRPRLVFTPNVEPLEGTQ